MRMKSRIRLALYLLALVMSVAVAAIPLDSFAAHSRPGARASRRAPEAPPAVPLSEIHVFGDRPAPFALEAKSAMLIDARSGALLYEYNEHEKMQPASLAKMMTFYLTLEALHQKRISLDTQVTISEAAWRLSMNQSVSRMFLGVGQKVPVRDLLYGLMVSSGNDAAVALAEYLGGSTQAFTEQMNRKAHELGLNETHFMNPDGLPVEGEYTTAADMVKLGRDLLIRFPDATTYTGTKEFTFDKIKQRNFNTLLFYDSRVHGIKTGHVDVAGYHLVASADANGMMLISAVMGTPSMEQRRLQTEKLIDWAFRTFATVRPDWHKAVPASIRVYQGVGNSVEIAPASDCYVTVERGRQGAVAVAYAAKAKYLLAPVSKGDTVGELSVTQDGKPVASIPVVTQSAVARGGLFKRALDRVRMML
jgi:serine-type D-Ala-D-Ala carboxypeptidase (penicillin-binding protein 5/6)